MCEVVEEMSNCLGIWEQACEWFPDIECTDHLGDARGEHIFPSKVVAWTGVFRCPEIAYRGSVSDTTQVFSARQGISIECHMVCCIAGISVDVNDMLLAGKRCIRSCQVGKKHDSHDYIEDNIRQV